MSVSIEALVTLKSQEAIAIQGVEASHIWVSFIGNNSTGVDKGALGGVSSLTNSSGKWTRMPSRKISQLEVYSE